MASIHDNKLFFSDEKKYRIRRHLLFWAVWGLWFFLPRVLNPAFFQKNGHFPNAIKIMIEAFIFLLSQPILVYSLLYFILPRYVYTGKYIKASLCIIALLLLTVFVNIVLYSIPWKEVFWFLPSKYRPFPAGGGDFKINDTKLVSSFSGYFNGCCLRSEF
jgi:hypothetical protein